MNHSRYAPSADRKALAFIVLDIAVLGVVVFRAAIGPNRVAPAIDWNIGVLAQRKPVYVLVRACFENQFFCAASRRAMSWIMAI